VYVLIILFPIWNGIVRNEKTACLLVFVLSTLTNGKLHLSHFSLDLQIGYGFDILLNVWEPLKAPKSDLSNRAVFRMALIGCLQDGLYLSVKISFTAKLHCNTVSICHHMNHHSLKFETDICCASYNKAQLCL